MKLKKIVSLALAGIMAVSMLAGCGDNATDNGGASSNETTTVTGYSAMLGEKAAETLEKNDHDDVFTFADDADAQKTLKKVVLQNVTQANVNNLIPSTTVVGTWEKSGVAQTVGNKFYSEMKAVSGVNDGVKNYNDSVNTDKFVSVWVANGNIAMDTVMDEVFADIKESIKETKEEGNLRGIVDVNYAYEVSVSVENVAMEYDTTLSGSVNFIAVTVTRTAEIA